MCYQRIANFQKKKLFIGLGFLVVFFLLSIAVAPKILTAIHDSPNHTSTENNIDISEKDFPLEIGLSKTDYNVGEKIALKVTIINQSDKDVNMLSNGHQPLVIFHKINDNRNFGETSEGVYQVFKANEKITRVYEYEANETGTYVLDVSYHISINNVWFYKQVANITIGVNS
jgi:hypothetical protein